MNDWLPLIVTIGVNLLGMAVAYGRINAKLEAQDKLIELLRDELKTTRQRIHDLANRMGGYQPLDLPRRGGE